jgi:hypothetical protein
VPEPFDDGDLGNPENPADGVIKRWIQKAGCEGARDKLVRSKLTAMEEDASDILRPYAMRSQFIRD